MLTASGALVAISKLKPGDKVLATNTRTGTTQAEPVAAVLVHYDQDRYDLKVRAAGHTAVINTTSSHLFWNQSSRGWTKAAALKYGTHLHTPSGGTATVLGGWIPKVTTGWMWDLTIPGNNDHDFYIQTAVKTILVHNVNADDGSSCGEASAVGSSGLLGDDVAATFRGGRYTARTLDQDTTFYRAGVAGKPLVSSFPKTRQLARFRPESIRLFHQPGRTECRRPWTLVTPSRYRRV